MEKGISPMPGTSGGTLALEAIRKFTNFHTTRCAAEPLGKRGEGLIYPEIYNEAHSVKALQR